MGHRANWEWGGVLKLHVHSQWHTTPFSNSPINWDQLFKYISLQRSFLFKSLQSVIIRGDANQVNEVLSYTCQDLSPQKSVRMRRKWDPCTLLAGMQNGTVTVGNSMQALHKLKAELPCLSNHVPENISKVLIKIRTLRRHYTTMVIAHHPRPLKMEGRKKCGVCGQQNMS